MGILTRWYPDETADSAYSIDYDALYDRGFRGIIYDIDNTLVPHGAPSDERSENLISSLQNKGFRICFLSNNDRSRIEMFNRSIQTDFVENAHKPSKEGYNKAMQLMNTDSTCTVLIGDQIFTDIWGGNRSGIYSILVGQIAKKEEIQIVLKRYLEKIVLFFYRHSRQKG